MPWVRIDDHFDEHLKLAQVGPLAWGVWLAGIAYCNRNLTDGFIPRSKATTLCSFETVDDDGVIWQLSRTSGHQGEDIDSKWVIDLLVKSGLWDPAPGGYRIHDYTDFQPTKQQVIEEREKKRKAGRAGGKATAKARASSPTGTTNGTVDKAESKPVPVPKPVPVTDPNPPSGPVDYNNKSPLTPAQRGNPRSLGTNPRAIAKQRERDELLDQLNSCEECGDNPNVWCARCTGLRRRLSELSA